MENPTRIFVSYSQYDRQLVEQLVRILEENGFTVLWSSRLNVGEAFDEEIKRFIEHAHVFMPVLTESSLSRGWVQQEIGYALGLHIPVFPVTRDELNPGGMLEKIHAIRLEENEQSLKSQLNQQVFSALLKRSNHPAVYQKALRPESRAEMIKSYCESVSNIGESGIIRQKGGLSSFHIPLEDIEHSIWNERYYPEKRSDFHKEQQRNERLALQEHADKSSVRLIINPNYGIEGRDPVSAKARLRTLLDFLENHPGAVVISFSQNILSLDSLTMVGDWFLAESVSFKDGDGYTNTFFTRNANEIKRRIDSFEAELKAALNNMGSTELDSRKYVKIILKNLYDKII